MCPQWALGQAASVELSYRSPGVLTQGEPVSIELRVHNGLDEPASITLGKNHVGNLQLTLRKPTGEVISVDPRFPRRPDETYLNVPVTLESGEASRFIFWSMSGSAAWENSAFIRWTSTLLERSEVVVV